MNERPNQVSVFFIGWVVMNCIPLSNIDACISFIIISHRKSITIHDETGRMMGLIQFRTSMELSNSHYRTLSSGLRFFKYFDIPDFCFDHYGTFHPVRCPVTDRRKREDIMVRGNRSCLLESRVPNKDCPFGCVWIGKGTNWDRIRQDNISIPDTDTEGVGSAFLRSHITALVHHHNGRSDNNCNRQHGTPRSLHGAVLAVAAILSKTASKPAGTRAAFAPDALGRLLLRAGPRTPSSAVCAEKHTFLCSLTSDKQ